MVRTKAKTVKHSSNTSSEYNAKNSSNNSVRAEDKIRKVAKNKESSGQSDTGSEVSNPSHFTDISEKNDNYQNTDTLRKKYKSRPINVFLQSHRNKTTMNRGLYKQIRYLQKSVHPLIPRTAFGRVVKEILGYLGDFRIQTEALKALQESCELYATSLFEDSYYCALHAKRQTLYIADMNCVRRIRGPTDVINH